MSRVGLRGLALAGLVLLSACRARTVVRARSARAIARERAVELVVGQGFACARTVRGAVRCWGSNSAGQLGDPTYALAACAMPREVRGLTDVAALAAGASHACALRGDGRVWCWGENDTGQTTAPEGLERGALTVVPGVSDAIALGAGPFQTCAVVRDGRVWCWGATPERSGPRAVPGIDDAREVVVGDAYACARSAAGRVRCWGPGAGTRFGGGSGRVVEPPGFSGAVQLAASAGLFCARMRGGAVRCVAADGAPQGEGDLAWASLRGARDVSVADQHACAVLSDGAVRCWGLNEEGELGEGTTDDRDSPSGVPGANVLTGALRVGAGYRHSCALLVDGSVRCWGSNTEGQLGDGVELSDDERGAARVVPGLERVAEVAVGERYVCARGVDGGVRCAGGRDEQTRAPGEAMVREVEGLGGVSELVMAGSYAAARGRDGRVWRWRAGAQDAPGVVAALAGVERLAVDPQGRLCGRTRAGALHCDEAASDGAGEGGRAADEGEASSVRDVARVALGAGAWCVASARGELRCARGRALDGAGLERVALTQPATRVTIGVDRACALERGGAVECWPLAGAAFAATRVDGVGLARDVAVYGGGGCVVARDGAVACWGRSAVAGDDVRDGLEPRVVPDARGALQVAVGEAWSCARMGDGAVRCWGEGRPRGGALRRALRPVSVAF